MIKFIQKLKFNFLKVKACISVKMMSLMFFMYLKKLKKELLKFLFFSFSASLWQRVAGNYSKPEELYKGLNFDNHFL